MRKQVAKSTGNVAAYVSCTAIYLSLRSHEYRWQQALRASRNSKTYVNLFAAQKWLHIDHTTFPECDEISRTRSACLLSPTLTPCCPPPEPHAYCMPYPRLAIHTGRLSRCRGTSKFVSTHKTGKTTKHNVYLNRYGANPLHTQTGLQASRSLLCGTDKCSDSTSSTLHPSKRQKDARKEST